MIRQLQKEDQETCLTFVRQKPAENLFIIGDIEAFGMETDFQKVWGQFNEANELVAVLLNYHSSYLPYAEGTYDAEGFASIINADPNFKAMSGLKDVTTQLDLFIKKPMKKKQTYYAKCSAIKTTVPPAIKEVQPAQPEDAKVLLDLLKQIPEFSQSMATSVEKKQQDLRDGFSRSSIVRHGEIVVSAASTTAENSSSAMIVGVATLQDFKRNGYASACVYDVCRQLFSEGKEACLFYDNPSAGVIYKNIGFEDIGLWMMYNEKVD